MREEINAKTAYVMTNDEETIPGDPPCLLHTSVA